MKIGQEGQQICEAFTNGVRAAFAPACSTDSSDVVYSGSEMFSLLC